MDSTELREWLPRGEIGYDTVRQGPVALIAESRGLLTDAAAAIAAVERQVRERYPMIKRLFIEAGAAPAQQRWSRPDSTQAPTDLQ